jgi:hypothetical protein
MPGFVLVKFRQIRAPVNVALMPQGFSSGTMAGIAVFQSPQILGNPHCIATDPRMLSLKQANAWL